jgi:hypothetical protein
MDMTGLEKGYGASGVRGVYLKASVPTKPWGVRIVSGGQSLWLGSYATIAEAAEVVREHRAFLPRGPDATERTSARAKEHRRRTEQVREAVRLYRAVPGGLGEVEALRAEVEALRGRVAYLEGIMDRELGL